MMQMISFKVPGAFIEAIDEIVRLGIYASRSEVVRTAIRDLLRVELWEPALVAGDNSTDYSIQDRSLIISRDTKHSY